MFDTQMVAKWNLRRELMKLSDGEFYDTMSAVRGPDGRTGIVGALKFIFTAHIRRMVFVRGHRVNGLVSDRSALEDRAAILENVVQIKRAFNEGSPDDVYAWHYLEHVCAALRTLSQIPAYSSECAFLLEQADALIIAFDVSKIAGYL